MQPYIPRCNQIYRNRHQNGSQHRPLIASKKRYQINPKTSKIYIKYNPGADINLYITLVRILEQFLNLFRYHVRSQIRLQKRIENHICKLHRKGMLLCSFRYPFKHHLYFKNSVCSIVFKATICSMSLIHVLNLFNKH